MSENTEREENLEPVLQPGQGYTEDGHSNEDDSVLDPKLKKGIIMTSVVLVVVFLAVLGYQYLQEENQKNVVDGSTRLVRVQQLMNEGNTDGALMGTSEVQRGGEPIMGYKEIAEKYSSVEAGKTAALNAGKIFLDKGDHENALEMFNIAVDSESMLTILAATAGKAAIKEEKGDNAEASSLYIKASKLTSTTNLKQQYTYYAGINSAAAGEKESAAKLLNDAIMLSPGAQWANMARAELGRNGMKIAY